MVVSAKAEPLAISKANKVDCTRRTLCPYFYKLLNLAWRIIATLSLKNTMGIKNYAGNEYDRRQRPLDP
jgi:hypothetical protein